MSFQGTERYEVVRRLGAGSFGEVYQVRDNQRGDEIAVKVLKRLEAEALYRFKREFRALADIRHPNLVSLYELEAEGELWFLTMELVEGSDFIGYLRGGVGIEAESTEPAAGAAADQRSTRDLGPARGATACEQRLRRALRQLCLGVDALHRAGKLHRDVKPQNALVTPEGQVKLLDFGLVAELGPGHSTDDRVVGTAAYMAPEQATGGEVTAAADWYAVGVVLYEALTGRLPFMGQRLQVLLDKQSTDPTPPDEIVQAPSDLSALCMRLLVRDPSQRPEGSSILDALGAVEETAEVATTAAAADQPVFVGRDEELSALEQAFEASQQGRAVVAHISGPSGMGKTALVHQHLERLAVQYPEAVLLGGRCYQRESVPYKALDSLIDGLCHHLRRLPAKRLEGLVPREAWALLRLFPVLERVDALAAAPRPRATPSDQHDVRRRGVGALKELLARLADRHPMLLYVDDLQWGDLDSALLLSAILGPPDPPALVVLLSYRSDDAARSPAIKQLITEHGPLSIAEVVRVELGPLTGSIAERLAEALLADTDGPSLGGEIARESGGSPFFVTELARRAAGRQAGYVGAAGLSLKQLITARIEALPLDQRRLLEALAVAGGPVATSVLADAVGRPDALRESLAGLHRARLIRSSAAADKIETYHDRVRETVFERVNTEQRLELHRALGAALEAAGGCEPEVLAEHFLAAGDAALAARYAEQAADKAFAELAFQRAAQLFQLAIDAGRDDKELHLKRGEALSNAGRCTDAAQALLTAAATTQGLEASTLKRRAAELFCVAGEFDRGMEVFDAITRDLGIRFARSRASALASTLARRVLFNVFPPAIRVRDPGQIPPEELTRIDICISMAVSVAAVDNVRAWDLMTRLLRMVHNAGEPRRLAYALAAELAYLESRGKRGARLQRTRQRLEEVLARVTDPHERDLVLCSVEAQSAFERGKYRECLVVAERELGLLDKLDPELAVLSPHFLRTMNRHHQLVCLRYVGRIDDYRRRCDALLEDAVSRCDHRTEIYVRWERVFCLCYQDQPVAAQEEIRMMREVTQYPGHTQQNLMALLTDLNVRIYTGQWESACALIERQQELIAWTHRFETLMASLYTRVVCGYVAVGAASAAAGRERSRLLRRAEREARRIKRSEQRYSRGMGQILEAAIMACNGDRSQALERLARAEVTLEATQYPLFAAAARWRRGELMGAAAGAGLIETSDVALRAAGAGAPARLVNMLAPGFSQG